MWKVFSANSKEYHFSSNFDNNSLKIRITDFILVWQEVLLSSDITERFKECNSIDGDFEVEKIITIFKSDLSPDNPDVNKTITIEESSLKLTLSSEMKDLSFNFTLSVCSPDEFYKYITLPTLLVLGEVSSRQDKLKQLIEEKDNEIVEYQLEGAKLFRKYLKTKKFIDKEFKEECLLSTDSNLHEKISSISKVFNEEVNSIYEMATKTCENYRPGNVKAIKEEISDTSTTSAQDDDTKPKKLKWELGPQNVKRFKNKRKINI